MKKSFILLLMVFSVAILSLPQLEATINDPTGAWLLEESSGDALNYTHTVSGTVSAGVTQNAGTGIVSKYYDFSGTNSFVNFTTTTGSGPFSIDGHDGSFVILVNFDIVGGNRFLFGKIGSAVEEGLGIAYITTPQIRASVPYDDLNTGNNPGSGKWLCLAVTYNDGTKSLKYYNNASTATASKTLSTNIVGANDWTVNIGRAEYWNDLDGKVDEALFYNRELTGAEVGQICGNWSNGIGFPFTGAAPGMPYITVNVKDVYDDANLEGINITLADGASNLTNSVGNARFNGHNGQSFSTYDPNSLYFAGAGTATENATTNALIYGSKPTFSVYDVEGTKLSGFNLTSPETANTTISDSAALLLKPNVTTNINVTKDTYYLLEANHSSTGQDTSDNNITGLYQSIVTINATNAFTGTVLSNFSGWLYNNDTGYNYSFSTTGNNATVNVIYGNFIGYIDVNGYSIGPTNTQELTVDNSTETLTYALYSENSIYITIRNEATNNIITDNVTVTVSGNATEDIYYTTTGTLFLENLTDGNYSIKFEASNYSLRTYQVTVADRSTQELTAYLSAGTDTVILTIIDFDNSQVIEGASIIMQRLINSTWTTVESKNSDITGRAQFTYTIGVKYRFTVSSTGYDTKIFELDPIIFTSYVIRLEKDLELDNNEGLFDVTITYYPVTFTNNANNSFAITFGSNGGTLEDYGYYITYPGGGHGGIGSNANGGTFINDSFLIIGATFTDRVNLTYWYDSVYGENKTYNVLFIIDESADPGTIYELKNYDYGLGTVDKIIIAIICTLIFTGVLTLFGSPILGGIGGLIMLGFFTTIGFLSIWITIPSFVVGLLLILRRSGE